MDDQPVPVSPVQPENAGQATRRLDLPPPPALPPPAPSPPLPLARRFYVHRDPFINSILTNAVMLKELRG
ncbi:MAG TPA: hypothetical protein VM186_14660, partial [Planctomycetota bacterium]|nr:hypothetical protein [Planctomycetota bacterium]